MLVFHYHLFKNAGTSVDEMLKINFGDKWEQGEFRHPAGKHSNTDEVAAFLRLRPHLRAFSSHTALLPLPEIGRLVFPIFFIRHPIDRINSAYSFERRQIADTHGARLAKEQDFPGYVRRLLESPGNGQARNFQTSRLARNEPPENGTELERAMRTLDQLPFVGLVEEYDRSTLRLQECLADSCPEFRALVVHRNKTQEAPEPLEQRLAKIEKELGIELYSELLAANLADIAIYEKSKARHDAR